MTMWPITLHGEQVQLRPPRFSDRKQWNRVRAENRLWLEPWEATLPQTPIGAPASEFINKRPSF